MITRVILINTITKITQGGLSFVFFDVFPLVLGLTLIPRHCIKPKSLCNKLMLAPGRVQRGAEGHRGA